MQFTVPQFIERPAKIVGPLTFKQFIFVGIAGGICIFLYFTAPFSVFVGAVIVLGGGSLALAFLKIERIPLPIFIKNLFVFLSKPKVYLWKKKAVPPKIIKKELPEKEAKKTPPKIASKSLIRDLSTRIETK